MFEPATVIGVIMFGQRVDCSKKSRRCRACSAFHMDATPAKQPALRRTKDTASPIGDTDQRKGGSRTLRGASDLQAGPAVCMVALDRARPAIIGSVLAGINYAIRTAEDRHTHTPCLNLRTRPLEGLTRAQRVT